VHEGQVGIHALELGVLGLQFTQLRQVGHRHAAVLGFPLVVSRLADAVLSARLADLGAQFDFFQDADYLAFAEFLFLHVETPLGEFSLLHTGSRFQGGFSFDLLEYF
jgi:hypothetical protein